MNAAAKLMTADEFLTWCLRQEDKWELVGGVPVRMMTGATQVHDSIVVNVIANLHRRLRGGPCRPMTDDIAARMPVGNIRRPDVTVDCGAGDPESLESASPRAFFEVLSPSTRLIDQVEKPEEYKQVESLEHIVLLEPGAPHALVYSRTAAGAWDSADIEGLEAVIDLPGLAITLPLAEAYEGVPFPSE